MANPALYFLSGSTSVTMSCLVPRLSNWTPYTTQIGPSEVAVGTGLTYRWNHRIDYMASFEFPNITTGQVGNALNLITHLEGGNTVKVITNDASSSIYTCYMQPGRSPDLSYTDRVNKEYTLTLYLKNASSAHMLAYY